jgi:hypothetical protein
MRKLVTICVFLATTGWMTACERSPVDFGEIDLAGVEDPNGSPPNEQNPNGAPSNPDPNGAPSNPDPNGAPSNPDPNG